MYITQYSYGIIIIIIINLLFISVRACAGRYIPLDIIHSITHNKHKLNIFILMFPLGFAYS